MKVKELAEICKTPITVRSGYDGKILCKNFNLKRHVEIGEREITAVWSVIKSSGDFYCNSAHPVICVFVKGTEEFEKWWENK